MYKLQQDNSEKLTIKISKNDLEYELKRFFNWRTATKKYKSISDRFFHQVSHNYDRFIRHCYLNGYGKF